MKSVNVVFWGNVLLIASLSKTITTPLVKTETIVKRDALFLNKDLIGSSSPSFDLVAFKTYTPANVTKTPPVATALGLSDSGGIRAISRVKIGPREIKGQMADKLDILIARKPVIWEAV